MFGQGQLPLALRCAFSYRDWYNIWSRLRKSPFVKYPWFKSSQVDILAFYLLISLSFWWHIIVKENKPFRVQMAFYGTIWNPKEPIGTYVLKKSWKKGQCNSNKHSNSVISGPPPAAGPLACPLGILGRKFYVRSNKQAIDYRIYCWINTWFILVQGENFAISL